MKRATALLLVTGVFLAGVATGALGWRYVWMRWSFQQRMSSRLSADSLRDRLGLSPEQSRRVGSILEETRSEWRGLYVAQKPAVKALVEKSASRIEEVLTPGQREEFARLRRELGPRADYVLLGAKAQGGHHRHGRSPTSRPVSTSSPPEEPGAAQPGTSPTTADDSETIARPTPTTP